jgi:hypothetical protein
MIRNTRLVLAVMAGAFFAVQAGATTITSTSFSGWKSSLTGSPNEADFSAVSYTNYNTSSGITLSGIGDSASQFTFTGPDNGSYALSGVNYNNFVALQGSADANAGINVALPGSGENAFLLVVGSTGSTGLTLTLSDGESFSLSSGLFGVSISHPVTSFSLTTSVGSQAVIDDFWYGASSLTQDSNGSNPPASDPGSGAAAPEGATILMVAGGSLILIGARRKFVPAMQTLS